MLSFKNDPEIKTALIKRMDDHIALDELVKGATGQDGKGCTVWCALNNGDLKEGYNHAAFESILGLPEWLAQLQDTIFEGLSVEDAKAFSSAWPKAIPVGKNLDPVKWRFCAFIMKQNIERVLLLNISDDLKKQVVDAINRVLSLHETTANTGVWDESAAVSAVSAARSAAESAWSAAAESAWSAAAWSAAAESAWSAAAESAWSAAAWSAAWSAAAESAWSAAAESAWSAAVWSVARSAAWSAAAESARSAAWSAAAWSAWSAAAESAWSAARSAAYKLYADELIRLLEQA